MTPRPSLLLSAALLAAATAYQSGLPENLFHEFVGISTTFQLAVNDSMTEDPPPHCSFTVLDETCAGTPLRRAKVGNVVCLRWQCVNESAAAELRVVDLSVVSRLGSREAMLDVNGCDLGYGAVRYQPGLASLSLYFPRFASSDSLQIQATIQMCQPCDCQYFQPSSCGAPGNWSRPICSPPTTPSPTTSSSSRPSLTFSSRSPAPSYLPPFVLSCFFVAAFSLIFAVINSAPI